jgi:hypothetical protein
MRLKFLSFIIFSVVAVNSIAQELTFKRDSEIGTGLGMFGSGDPLLKKQLGTGVGKVIKISEFYVWSYDGSDWEKGGKLHLINDDSMGRQYRVTCSLPANLGDKFMADSKRRSINITGKIASYSSSSGLVIDPCNATW